MRFGSGIKPEDVEVRNSGNNVVFVATLPNGGGRATFIDANKADPCYQMDEIHFADGTVWTWSEIAGRKVVRGTNSNDTLRAASLPGEKVTVYGLGGHDTIFAGAGDDTFVPGIGNNVIYARSNVEGGGNKTFVWNVGDWNNTVHYFNETHQPGDGMGILRFGSGVDPNNVTVRNNGNNVVFGYTGGGVTFVGANTADVRYHLDEIRFADGTVWTWSTMPRQ